MAKVYYDLIKKGLKTIKQVPESIRAEVQALLDADNGQGDFIIYIQKGGTGNGSCICNTDC